jgi:DNA-binding transcriptional ArsR family regulator
LTEREQIVNIRHMSKSENQTIDRYTEIFKALSNPNRLKIFMRLVSCCMPGTVCTVDENPSAYVGDLASGLDLVPSTVSHHIKELRRAGLIKMKRQGQRVECWVDPEVLKELSGLFT